MNSAGYNIYIPCHQREKSQPIGTRLNIVFTRHALTQVGKNLNLEQVSRTLEVIPSNCRTSLSFMNAACGGVSSLLTGRTGNWITAHSSVAAMGSDIRESVNCVSSRLVQRMTTEGDKTDLMKKLSEGQRDCLRLVNQHRSSKEIARILQISRHTVDQRLALACRILNSGSRREAARLFAAYDPIIYELPYIADGALDAPAFPHIDYREGQQEQNRNQVVQDTDAPYFTHDLINTRHFALPFPLNRGDQNDLTNRQRMTWAAVIFVASILVSGILIVALEALGRLL
jgi:DNA-binding CsgD family transcriptional regulator